MPIGSFRSFRAVAPRLALLAASIGFSISCNPAALTIENPTASVAVSGSSTVRVGENTKFEATPYDAKGGVLLGDVTWSSSNPAVAMVSSGGIVSGVSTGTATISAEADDGSKTIGTATITVTPGRVTYIGVTPLSASIAAQATVQLSTQVKDVVGNVLTDRTLRWVSSDPTVATVNDQGLVSGVAVGSATIGVKTNDPDDTGQGSATITVTPSLFTSWKLDSVSTVRSVTWTDAGVATLTGTITFAPPSTVTEGQTYPVSTQFAWTLTSLNSREINMAFDAEIDDRTVDPVNGTRLGLTGHFTDANPSAPGSTTTTGNWSIPASYHTLTALRLCAVGYGAFGGFLVVTGYYHKLP